MSVFGFPLRVSPWIFVVLFALGQGTGLAALLAFMIGGVAAIAVHELGHALAARGAGATDVRMELTAFGGLTTFAPAPESRLQRIWIAVAGPLTGLLLGVPLLALRFGTGMDPHSTASSVLNALLVVTIGWAVLNLLPVLPFDGGQVLVSSLPGDEETRTRVAAALSVVIAGAAAFFFWQRDAAWSAAVFGLLAAMNVITLVTSGRNPQAQQSRSYAVLRAVLAGRLDAARAAMQEGRVDPVVAALVDVAEGGGVPAAAQLERVAGSRPDPLARSSLVVLRASQRDWDGVGRLGAEGGVPPDVLAWAVSIAARSGAAAAGARAGQAALAGSPGAVLAHATARAWAAAGEPSRAFDAVVYAVALGWDDLAALDVDPVLAPVRALAPWPGWRQGVGAAAVRPA
ncbi:metalloprotease [Motilibacter deserti]|uniref:Peptidase M50 domain-containing protein n=1 Tax=Motilibacter deserti TaxID=2714956 RepID=A0ABX0GZB2_9ACTN|nr:M50 family metallopeptidase [Motilibacter deserti]NHC14538.1 hypothetical protein [Motilibacter deserti]